MFGRKLEPGFSTITGGRKIAGVETGVIFDRHAPPFIPGGERVTTHEVGVMTERKVEGNALLFQYTRDENHRERQRIQQQPIGTDLHSRLRRLGIHV